MMRVAVNRNLKLALLALAIMACAVYLLGLSEPAEGKTKVRMAYFAGPVNLVPVYAIKHGFLEAEGIRADAAPVSSTPAAFGLLGVGRIDYLTAADAPGVFYGLKDKNFSIIAATARSEGELGLIALETSGIKSFSDLQDKRIGLVPASLAELFLRKQLTESGVNASRVKIVQVLPENMAAALEKGSVDAVYVWEPVITRLADGFAGRVRVLRSDSAVFHEMVYASKAARPETTRKVLDAFGKAAAYLKAHPDEETAFAKTEFGIEAGDWTKITRFWAYGVIPARGEPTRVMTEQALLARELGLANFTAAPEFDSLTNWPNAPN